MRAEEVINLLREDITNTQVAGHTVIDPQLLLARLSTMAGWIQEDEDLDKQRSDLHERVNQLSVDLGRDSTRHKHEWDLEMFRSVITSGQGALKAVLLVAGGGAAALLAFLGHLVSSKSVSYVPAIAEALMYMVWAVLAAALAVGGTYLSQWLFGRSDDKPWQRAGATVQCLSILAFLAALVFFAAGAWHAHTPFLKPMVV